MIRTFRCLALPLALLACAGEDDLQSTALPIIGGEIDTTHFAVGELISDSSYCSGTLISPRRVISVAECTGLNMKFVIHDGDHLDERIVVRREGSIYYLDRPIAHVLPVAHPPNPQNWVIPSDCEVVGFGVEGVRRSTPALVDYDVNDHPEMRSIEGVLEYFGDRGAPLLCSGQLAGLVSDPSHNGLESSYNHLRSPNYHRTDLLAISTAGASPQGRVLHPWGSDQLDVGLPMTLPASAPGAWRFGGVGDFDRDHHEDLAWHDTATGEVRILYTRVGSPSHSRAVGGMPASTIVQGIGDFDGDRAADILWRDASGQLSMWPAGVSGNAMLVGYDHRHRNVPVGFDWAVRGVSDFDGDGRSDILWRHTSGTVAIWYMVANDRHGELVTPMHDPSAVWKIEGVGYIDQNDVGDIVWRDTAGQVVIWFNGSNHGAVVSGTRDHSWSFGGVLDMNLYDSNDIIWRNGQGQVSAWWMSAHTVLNDAPVTFDQDSARALPIVGTLVEARRWPTLLPVEKAVPDVVGMTGAQATDTLTARGFQVTRLTEVDYTCSNVGLIMDSSPGAGALVPWGGNVTITEGLRPPVCH
jgi:PASTA domain